SRRVRTRKWLMLAVDLAAVPAHQRALFSAAYRRMSPCHFMFDVRAALGGMT
ncbi:hypothetical protein ACLOJK_015190, partial [Asimina triloba]